MGMGETGEDVGLLKKALEEERNRESLYGAWSTPGSVEMCQEGTLPPCAGSLTQREV